MSNLKLIVDGKEYKSLMYYNGLTNEVIAKVNIDSKIEVIKFFRDLSKFVKTKKSLRTINSKEWYQFAIESEGNVVPIIWFDIQINEKVKISHDFAFETVIIHKNSIRIDLGNFPLKITKKFPKYREFNIKSKAYKYIANQLMKI